MSSTPGNITVRNLAECKVELDWTLDDFSSHLNSRIATRVKSPTFTWSDIDWQLDITTSFPFRNRNENSSSYSGINDPIRLFLNKITHRKQLATMFEFAIRMKSGAKETRCILIKSFTNFSISFGTEEFILASDLLRRRHQLMPDGILTISCLIAHRHSLPYSERYESLDVLSSDFKRMFECSKNSDMTVIVGEETFPVHKVILAAGSDVFAAMFEHNMEEAKTGIIKISDCEATCFKDFLLFLYTGRIENFSWNNVCNLYRIADKYNVQNLKGLCIKYIKKSASATNFFDIVHLANQFDDTKLDSAVQQVFNKFVNGIIQTYDWEQYMKQNFRKANQFLVNLNETTKAEYNEECIAHS